MKEKIVYLGNFGSHHNFEGSQIRKTKSIVKYLEKNNFKVITIDTDCGKFTKKLINFSKYLLFVLFYKKIIISLNTQGLSFGNYIFIRYVSKFFKNKQLIFITIGGWLAEFIENNPKIKEPLMRFDSIYVQTETIQKKLYNLGFTNTSVMYNFSNFSLLNLDHRSTNVNENPIKTNRDVNNIVFFSFIKQEKGVKTAVEAVNEVNQFKIKYNLDFIGPVDEKYRHEFCNLIQNNPYINYKGFVKKEEDILNTLENYDLMIFPTYYEGEGFPTVIVEAFAAGLPVVASDWKYNSEIIENGKTGMLFKSRNVESLTNALNYLYDNRQCIQQMKKHVLKEAYKYHINNVLKPLREELAKEHFD